MAASNRTFLPVVQVVLLSRTYFTWGIDVSKHASLYERTSISYPRFGLRKTSFSLKYGGMHCSVCIRYRMLNGGGEVGLCSCIVTCGVVLAVVGGLRDVALLGEVPWVLLAVVILGPSEDGVYLLFLELVFDILSSPSMVSARTVETFLFDDNVTAYKRHMKTVIDRLVTTTLVNIAICCISIRLKKMQFRHIYTYI